MRSACNSSFRSSEKTLNVYCTTYTYAKPSRRTLQTKGNTGPRAERAARHSRSRNLSKAYSTIACPWGTQAAHLLKACSGLSLSHA